MSDQEYTDEEYATEMQRIHEALDAFTEADWKAFFNSPEAKKRQRHAMSYRMRPRKFAFKYTGCQTGRLTARNASVPLWPAGPIDFRVPQGDPTEYERTRKLVMRHWSAAMQAHCDFIPHRVEGDLGYGTVLCHSEQGHEAFRSFLIDKAIKQTIAERYETKTI